MRAEIISIGTELLLAETQDTNSHYLARQLPQFGIDLLYATQVGDNPERLHEVLARAWGRSDLTITTGGLGPTEDDLTRETIALVLGEQPTLDPDAAAKLREWFAERGQALLERNLKQAMRIPAARLLPNPRGTAPGWWVEREEPQGTRILVVLPGPPAEMTAMWQAEAAPALEARARSILVTRTLKTAGLGESQVDETLSDLLDGTNPSIGIYHKRDGVHVRIGAKAPAREQAEALIAPLEALVRERIGAYVWGIDDDTLAAGVGRLLRGAGLTLGVMESATGGALASALTDPAGASDYFRGSHVTYATEAKIAAGVAAEVIERHGLYSRDTAEAMAQAARAQFGADIGIGLSGIAGTQQREGQEPGTMHIAVATPDGVTYRSPRRLMYQGREMAKHRAVTAALLLLRERLMAQA